MDDKSFEFIQKIYSELKNEVSSVRKDLSNEISSVKHDLSNEISSVKQDLLTEIRTVSNHVLNLENDLQTRTEALLNAYGQYMETLERIDKRFQNRKSL